ncbi:hypothetical protein ABPG77_000542 [Micractinium sp. CCAP 211/92]
MAGRRHSTCNRHALRGALLCCIARRPCLVPALQESHQLVAQQAAAVRGNDKLGNAVAARERAADEVARDIEMAKVEAERLLAEQVTWDLEVKKRKGDAKREAAAVRAELRGRDVTQRRLNRAELEAKELQEQLPELQNTVASLASQLAADQQAVAAVAQAAAAQQAEVERMVEGVVAQKKMTEVQSSLVQAVLADARQLEQDSAALQAAGRERDKAIKAATSQRDGAVRFLDQQLHKLAELVDEAEAKDGEVGELHRKQREMGRFKGLLEYARRGAEDLTDRVAAAEEELAQLKHRAAALAAKAATQAALLERNEEMVGLFERSAALQQELDSGTLALQRCDDDMRLLQLEVAELQRSLSVTHKTAPDVVSYDRQIAALKADVLRARNEAEGLGAALEAPAECRDRWRVLPGRLPSREELAARVATIEERLAARKDLAVQKDTVLGELERLTEGLVDKARASHDPALGLAMGMNEARRQQQLLTRRMMATVSELSLYQALSLKCAADRDTLAAELAQAKRNMAAGRPPTAGADLEFERQERDRAAEAEVRAQAAELRRLKADGLLGTLRSAASPRPQAYIPEDLGVPKPFPATFRPFKPSGPPAAIAVAVQRAAAGAAAAAEVQCGEQQLLLGVQASADARPAMAAACAM